MKCKRSLLTGIAVLVIAFGGISALAVTIEQEAFLLPNNVGEFDTFGGSVSMSGDTAMIGARGSSTAAPIAGSVYAYTRNGGIWALDDELLAPDASVNDRFGISVAVDGDTVVIGASGDEAGSGATAGSVYVFVRVGGLWTLQAKLTASDADSGDEFGYSVDLDGGTIVVGARYDEDNGADAGSVYVFTGAGSVWSQQAKLIAPDGDSNDEFGNAVDVDGNTLLIGAWADEDNGADAGSVYVFTGAGSVWSQQAKLMASGPAVEGFGYSVTLDGNTAVVGAPGVIGDFDEPRSAHVYTRTAGVWSEQTKLSSPGPGGSRYGTSVALDDDNLLIGDPVALSFGTARAYLYSRSDGVWTEQAQIEPIPANPSSWFGIAVALEGEAAVIGAYVDETNGQNAGAAYGYGLTPDDDDGGVPAVGAQGTLLLLLAFLASGFYFVRRRARI